MSSIYKDAIADAKMLRDVAEQNAKNAIIEAVTPRIRKFIDDQLLENNDSSNDSADFLGEIAADVVGDLEESDDLEASDDIDEVVELDESALLSLVELLTGDKFDTKSTRSAATSAMKEAFNDQGLDERRKLANMVNKLNEKIELFEGSGIDNTVQHVQESTSMGESNDETLYEVDLEELADMADDMMSEADDDVDEGVDKDVDEASDVDETAELMEILNMLGISSSVLDEAKIQIDLGDDVDLPPDLQLIASLMLDDEEEVDEDDLDAAELDDELDDDEMPLDDVLDAEVEEEEDESLDEFINIDEVALKKELRLLSRKLAENKDITKIKGIKDAMEDHWGGKGDSKAGLKDVWGGKGSSGDDFGGGTRTGDPLKVKMNKLSETLKKERRNNRSLTGKLNKYRSAVESLREHLTELNLFNAKLLYVNKLLQNKDISSGQRRSVVESIDGAKSLGEVKLVYKTLTSSFKKTHSGNLNESAVRKVVGSSRPVTRSSTDVSSTGEVDRWATLAGLDK